MHEVVEADLSPSVVSVCGVLLPKLDTIKKVSEGGDFLVSSQNTELDTHFSRSDIFPEVADISNINMQFT